MIKTLLFRIIPYCSRRWPVPLGGSEVPLVLRAPHSRQGFSITEFPDRKNIKTKMYPMIWHWNEPGGQGVRSLIQWKLKFWNLNVSIGKKCICTNYNSSDQLAHLWLSFCLSTICFHICNVCDIVFPSLRSICLYLNWCTRPSDNFYNSKFFFFSFFSSFFCDCLMDLRFSHLKHKIYLKVDIITIF